MYEYRFSVYNKQWLFLALSLVSTLLSLVATLLSLVIPWLPLFSLLVHPAFLRSKKRRRNK